MYFVPPSLPGGGAAGGGVEEYPLYCRVCTPEHLHTCKLPVKKQMTCRTMFHELRLSMEALAYSPKCPGFAKNIIYKVGITCFCSTSDTISSCQAIAFASTLAPSMEAQQ